MVIMASIQKQQSVNLNSIKTTCAIKYAPLYRAGRMENQKMF